MAANKKGKSAKPKAPKKSEVPTAQPVQSPVPATITISAEEQANMAKMLQLARIEYLKTVNKEIVKEKRREIDSLDVQIREYLGTYMLIGYDLNNQPVEIVSADSPASNDALLERFRRVMFKINQNVMNSNGNDPFGTKDDNDDN